MSNMCGRECTYEGTQRGGAGEGRGTKGTKERERERKGGWPGFVEKKEGNRKADLQTQL